jgi:rod shape-determining protein MreC
MGSTRPLAWFMSMLLLGLAMIGVTRFGASTDLRDAAQVVAGPLQSSLHAVLAPLSNFVTNVGSYGDLRMQNQRLEADNARLKSQVAQLQEQAFHNTELNNLAQVAQQQPNQRFQTAQVVARDPSNLHDRIEIDRGSGDGLRAGMVVLGASGALVGTIRETLPNRAWVALVSDSQSNINAVIQESRALAIAQGSVGKRVRMNFVAETTDVKVGDSVLTSGLGGTYPPGLLIGRISTVQGQPQDIFKQVTVEPVERLDNLDEVLVLTSFTPSP